MREWTSKYNPFNSDKLFAHVHRWEKIQRGKPIPPPITVSIDPANICDLQCVFCNAEFVINENKGGRLEKEIMYDIPDFLKDWDDGVSLVSYHVKSVCIGGGGEPLLNKYTGQLMDRLVERDIGVGTVTNGTQIHNNLESLSRNTFVAVSVDAGNKETYQRLKLRDKFDQVIGNMRHLIDYSLTNNSLLGDKNKGHGVSYNFLIHPFNVSEVMQATLLAKDMGCRYVHMRPVCVPWFELGNKESPHIFKPHHIEEFNNQIEKAMKLEDDYFKVFGVTHKFNPDFGVTHHFENCYAIFMAAVITPPSDRNKGTGKYDANFCCDRRGDDLLTIRNLTDLNQIKDFWGSKEHWKMYDNIKVEKCPRCTFEPHNKIQKNVILRNSMNYDFI